MSVTMPTLETMMMMMKTVIRGNDASVYDYVNVNNAC